MSSTTSRRAILAGAAILPVASLPALSTSAIAAAEPDPIFAAIEAHRYWSAKSTERFDRQSDFELSTVLPRGIRMEEYPPWQPFNDAVNEAEDSKDAAARDLLHIEPTTVAGAAALVSYYVEAETASPQVFPELLDNDGNRVDPSTVTYDDPFVPTFGRLLARNVACALGRLVQS